MKKSEIYKFALRAMVKEMSVHGYSVEEVYEITSVLCGRIELELLTETRDDEINDILGAECSD